MGVSGSLNLVSVLGTLLLMLSCCAKLCYDSFSLHLIMFYFLRFCYYLLEAHYIPKRERKGMDLEERGHVVEL